MQIVIATRNAGKAAEFRHMLTDDRFDWKDLGDFPATSEVEETGRTFRANACIKAAAYAIQTRSWALADDSGLEVDALDGAPGVSSARWAVLQGTGKGDDDNNRTLLNQLSLTPDEKRTARFVCVLALADPEGRVIITTRDTVEGRILRQPRGRNGFGYDPLFLIDSLQQTTAELPAEQKHQISHRGRALRRLKLLLNERLRFSNTPF